eukprot:1581342-Rhodomonas_salina.2
MAMICTGEVAQAGQHGVFIFIFIFAVTDRSHKLIPASIHCVPYSSTSKTLAHSQPNTATLPSELQYIAPCECRRARNGEGKCSAHHCALRKIWDCGKDFFDAKTIAVLIGIRSPFYHTTMRPDTSIPG